MAEFMSILPNNLDSEKLLYFLSAIAPKGSKRNCFFNRGIHTNERVH